MRLQSKRGWFLLKVGGNIYWLMLCLGRFCLSWEKGWDK